MSGQWLKVDDAAFVQGVSRALERLVDDQRDKLDRLGERTAASAEAASDNKFAVTAKPGRRVQPIGGRYSTTVEVTRKHQAAHGRFYKDPGPAAAWWYEFGNSRQPPRPFLRPAIAQAAAEGL